MAYSFIKIAAAGDTNVFAVPFPYIAKTHVHTYIDAVEVAPTWTSDGTVQLPMAAADLSGKTVTIQRVTPNVAPLVVFSKGSLNNDDLNKLAKQCVYLSQELSEVVPLLVVSQGGLDFRGNRGINVADPQTDTDAVNQRWAESYVDTQIDGVVGETLFLFVEKDSVQGDTKFYIHQQPAAAASWVVNHNLNGYPKPAVYDTNGEYVLAEFKYQGKNQLTITFSSPLAGQAYVS